MAIVTGTTTHYTTVGVREDLEDVIWDVFAEDTYFLTNLDRVDANQVFHEWLGDNLAAAAANRQLDGDDVAFTTATQSTRYGNYCQISRKEIIVSGTVEAEKKAGRSSEVARQAMKKMRELKNDMELAIVSNQGSSAGSAVLARSSASMESWIAGTGAATPGNAVLASTIGGSTTPGFSAGVVAAPTDNASTAALTVAVLNEALRLQWTDGGNCDVIAVGTTQKAVIDGFVGQATRTVDVSRTAQLPIINAANVYVSSYGVHKVVLHRHVRASIVLCLDTEYWAVAFLRRPTTTPLARTGDAEKRMMLAEWTLVCRNPNASAKVASCA